MTKPGTIRARFIASPSGVFATGQDGAIEVMQENGDWLALTCVTAIDISVRPENYVRASVQLELSALDILVPPESVWWNTPAPHDAD